MENHLRSISLALAAALSLAVVPALADTYGGTSNPFSGMGGPGGSSSWNSPPTHGPTGGQSGSNWKSGTSWNGGSKDGHGNDHGKWANNGGWNNGGSWHGGGWKGGWPGKGHHDHGGGGTPTPTPTPTPVSPLLRAVLGLGNSTGSSSSMPDYDCTNYGYNNAPHYCQPQPNIVDSYNVE